MSESVPGVNNDRTINNLSHALDGAAKRQGVIANNIANVDVPNFKRSDVPFQEELKKAIERTEGPSLNVATTNKKHMAGIDSNNVNFTSVQETALTFRNDGNNVDIEKEMVEMTKNNEMYNAYVQLLVSKLGILKNTIREGK
jgi:flagellar basal-body rod protein FlgB